MSENLSVIGTQITMTSFEIAKLTKKRHDNVVRDIGIQLSKVCNLLKFEETYQHPKNKKLYKIYKLPRREVLILVSGYSVELRTRIIDRLEELEGVAYKYSASEVPSSASITKPENLFSGSNLPSGNWEKSKREGYYLYKPGNSNAMLLSTSRFRIDNEFATESGIQAQLERDIARLIDVHKRREWMNAFDRS